ncbi:MAG: CDP-alcohol phosphatidyltransferase family protein [Planctomycetes bacterium]|nr:CDP-alcohol phosphatidyltransferase family protein [Planctomycetota bacterium]
MIWASEALRRNDVAVLEYAGWLIVLATIFDALDGKVARLTHSASNFGAQLDSLADAITFGVAPAMMARTLVIIEQPIFDTRAHPRLLFVAPIIFAVCAVLRLARYNVEHDSGNPQESGGRGFVGLPSPAAAGLPTALVLFFFNVQDPDFLLPLSPEIIHGIQETILRVLPFVMVFVAVLMVSRVPYPHFFSWLTRSRNPFRATAETVIVFGLLLIEPAFCLLGAALAFTLLPAVCALPARLRASSSKVSQNSGR